MAQALFCDLKSNGRFDSNILRSTPQAVARGSSLLGARLRLQHLPRKALLSGSDMGRRNEL